MSVDGPGSMIADPLLAWYDANARVLPWRQMPAAGLPDPYRVWLSEIMLQQTTVTAVRPYFDRFTARWPSVGALAAADENELMAAWAGLGYYARARNLIACARAVVADHGGHFPASEAALRALPGIGAYTAAAIAAIAFGARAVVVDGNVERVVARLFAIEAPLPSARPALRELADRLTPNARAGDFAQAMMDLGATVCTPRSPRCGACPIAAGCIARARGMPEAFPVKLAKAVRPRRRGITWWIERSGAVLLIRREARGLLGGMRALPSSAWTPGEGDAAPPFAGDWAPAGRVAHVFTHFALDLEVRAAWAPAALAIEGEWWPIDRLGAAGLPSVFAKAAALGLAWRDDLGGREAA